ncbi:MAG: hypothetical protein JRJ09_03470 [Deltaproteobacteria bacterium]|nr:hypothetical protein [Deltaproteobacteria bacterium]HDZ91540.1 hypothetical protein [Deltaproteobacteria bacterium]
MIVQIYEIQTPQDAERCIELGVNHVGSVVQSMDVWRIPLLKETVRLSGGTDTKSSMIPLFQDRDTIYRVIDYYRPDYVHLCNSLTDIEGNPFDPGDMVVFQSELKERFPEVGIIRSIPVPKQGTAPDFPSAELALSLQPATDIFLTDTWLGREPVEGFLGITGQRADPEIARSLVQQSRRPVILAGGLSPDNVYNALMEVVPGGADTCTLTNRMDEGGNPVRFAKDFHKVKRFVEEVRRAENELRREKLRLTEKLRGLEEDLKDREAALPAHSVRPHQMMVIEAIEDEIEGVEKELARYKAVSV